MIYLLLVLVVVMFVFSKVQSNKRRKNAQSLEQTIQPGARVITTAGIYGIVVDIESDTIVLEISEGVDVRFAKAAVVRVVPDLVDADDADAAELDDDSDEQNSTLDDADLHAELDALDLKGSDADANSPSAEEVRSAQAREAARDRGHEPGTGAVPTT